MTAVRMGVGSLISRVARLISDNPLPIALAVAVPAAVAVAVDSGAEQEPRIQIFVSLAVTFAQFVMIGAVLRGEGQHHAWGKAGRAASFIGEGFVTGIAIAIGLCLAVLPGVFLYARWIAVAPLIIGEGCTMGEAMRRSWQQTKPAAGAIMACVAICWIGFVGAAIVMGFGYPDYGAAPLGAAIAANLLFTVSLVLSWVLAIAVHLDDPANEEEVLAGGPPQPAALLA
jgi:hypothetical protein